MFFGLFWGDATILVLIPAMIFAFWAQMKVNSTFKKYAKVPSRRFEVYLVVARYDTYEVPITVATKHQRLKYRCYILAQLLGNVRSGKVTLIHRIWHKLIGNLCPIEQARSVGLLYLFSHNIA